MAKRRHLPPMIAGKKYEGWMPLSDDEPVFSESPYYDHERCAEVYATKKAARATAEDVRRVTIIVETTARRQR